VSRHAKASAKGALHPSPGRRPGFAIPHKFRAESPAHPIHRIPRKARKRSLEDFRHTTEPDVYYSYRREEGKTGRLLAALALRP
jgi:hypothetical protein